MKTLSIILLVIIGLAVGAFSLVMGLTAPVVKAGDSFFEAWSNGQPQLSYPYLSQGFKQTNSANNLNQFMVANRLNQGVETSWSNRSVNNSVGKLVGELTRFDGSVMQVEINLIKENDLWKINALHFSTPTLTADNSNYAPNNQSNRAQTSTRSSKDNGINEDRSARSMRSIGASSEF